MRVFISLLLFLFVSGFALNSAHAAPTKWKINKYIIVQQEPSAIRLPYSVEILLQEKRDIGEEKGLTTKQMRALEQYFVDVGNEYQRQGFLEPQIDTLTKTGDAFEIFVFDYPNENNGPARYGPICASVFFLPNADRYVRVDLSRILNGSKMATKAYDDIAHEMFHAIQQSYRLFKNNYNEKCELGGWITEATAEAVGADMALTLKKVKINEIKTGPRDYSKPLYVQHASGATQNRAYWTASLWRYLGEYVSNGQKFPQVKQNKRPDYRYLQKFFMKTIDRYNQEAELDWLDDNLDAQFGTNLTNIYSNFISSFAHYVPDRIGLSQKSYLKQVFGKCDQVTLTESITFVDTPRRKFSKVSAHCIEVIYTGGAKEIAVGIYLESDKKTVDSIQHIGVRYHDATGNKKIKVLPASRGSLSSGKSFSDWTFEDVPFARHGRSSNVFIISNIAKRASDTHANPNVSFRVSYATSEGDVSISK
ncbi:MAG: hypothetical protein COA43_14345 [Robiginitomaculum sp.]|nr:MAG: hypothetical protein COA43_14345 [Robiginitomaculum sp.]